MQSGKRYRDVTISDEKEISKRCGELYKRAYMLRSWFSKVPHKSKTTMDLNPSVKF